MPVKKNLGENEWESFVLVGISSLLKDYRISFFLNEFLQADFEQVEPLQIIPKGKSETVKFKTFRWKSEYTGFEFFLFDNHSGKDILLPEVSKINFLVKISGEYDPKPMVEFLKQIPEVSTASILPLGKIKSHKNLEHNYTPIKKDS